GQAATCGSSIDTAQSGQYGMSFLLSRMLKTGQGGRRFVPDLQRERRTEERFQQVLVGFDAPYLEPTIRLGAGYEAVMPISRLALQPQSMDEREVASIKAFRDAQYGCKDGNQVAFALSQVGEIRMAFPGHGLSVVEGDVRDNVDLR